MSWQKLINYDIIILLRRHMSLQIQLQKSLGQVNFLESSIYEKNDLTGQLNEGQKFVVRQGDLVISNYEIDTYRHVGLRATHLFENNGIFIFRNSHFVIPSAEKTILVHNEHGVTIIPMPIQKLNFYTFDRGGD